VNEQLRERIRRESGNGSGDPTASTNGQHVEEDDDEAALEPVGPERSRVELVGMHLRVAGEIELGDFARLTDFMNVRDSIGLQDAVLLAGHGDQSRYSFHELRVRLPDITIIGQRDGSSQGDRRNRVAKRAPRIVVMTIAHIVTGAAYLHPQASLASLVEAEQRFMPMTDVRVQWLADRDMAARYPFALIQRSHIIGVAIEPVPLPGAATMGDLDRAVGSVG
jgi:hypothetical protein